ncbi:OmpH family outer membrane protein [Rhodobacterales bacterium HKCCSP123]|nr:OmpH family outer membrane protein [Rhodobacterales bacterium HKCCSP123]
MGLRRGIGSLPIRGAAAAMLALSLTGVPVAAQEATLPTDAPRLETQGEAPGLGLATLPIVVLNQERLLSQSLYGQRIQREVETAGAALSAENRRIEAQLTEEELRLTEQRATMSAEAFRPLAEEFDTRVEGIRAAQEAKSRALQSQAEAAQALFFEQVFPVLIVLMRERGAAVMMDNRAVLLSVEGADITDAAIALIDAEIGDGPDEPIIDLDGTASLPRQRP